MRLTCPHCDAQYEVDAAVIPEDGRDVQCSSCGHTWFQLSAAALVAAEETAPAAADDGFDDVPDLDDLPAAETAAATDAPDVAPAAPAAPKQRTLDDAVLNVLREEAERETTARQAEGSALEAQAEFGLAEAAPPAPVVTEVAPAAAEPDEGMPGDPLVARGSRRELLPDIEEINSTLRATSERSGDPAARNVPETLRQRRSGFRRGFLSALSVMILALLPYVLADSLATRVPSIAPAVTGYARAIDSFRLWLDGRMKSTTDSLRSANTAP